MDQVQGVRLKDKRVRSATKKGRAQHWTINWTQSINWVEWIERGVAWRTLAKINYRRLSGLVCKRHPFRADIGIPRARSRFLPAALPCSSLVHPKQIRGHFSVPCPAYIPAFLSFRRGACSAPRKRRREAAVGWSVYFLNVGPSLVTGWGEMGDVTGEEGDPRGRIVGGRYEGVSSWTRGTVGSRVRRQFFLLEFSKGNDLRYISKGFLLVGKRVRRCYPPTGGATACPQPPPASGGYRTICISQPLI